MFSSSTSPVSKIFKIDSSSLELGHELFSSSTSPVSTISYLDSSSLDKGQELLFLVPSVSCLNFCPSISTNNEGLQQVIQKIGQLQHNIRNSFFGSYLMCWLSSSITVSSSNSSSIETVKNQHVSVSFSQQYCLASALVQAWESTFIFDLSFFLIPPMSIDVTIILSTSNNGGHFHSGGCQRV